MSAKGVERPEIPQFHPGIVSQISRRLGLVFVPEKETGGNVCLANSEELRPEYRTTFAPVDLLDFFYAGWHSHRYREKYNRVLKDDFANILYPNDAADFWQLVELGGQLRKLHLHESPATSRYITRYPVDGDNEVTRPRFHASVIARRKDEAIPQSGTENHDAIPPDSGRVYINDSQYFDQVPASAWDVYIGDCQPAQKWLEDRKGHRLEFEDILHYRKIIRALIETDRLMKEIDGLERMGEE